MITATWNGVVLAESNETVIVEGNHYFPPNSINKAFFKPSSRSSVCPWKSKAGYCDIVANGQVNSGAAWYYPQPKAAADEIKDYVAFWKGIKIER